MCLFRHAKVNYLLTLLICVGCPAVAQKADSLLNSMISLPDTAKVIKLNTTAVEVFLRDLEQSRELAERALELSRKIGFSKGEAEALRIFANVYLRNGEFVKALEACREAEAIYASTNDRAGLATVSNTFGMVYSQQGQYALALESYTNTLRLQRELSQQEQIPKSIENIGIIHFRQGDYKLALDFFKECYQSYIDQGNEGSASKILVNLGATYNKLGMHSEALDAHQKSLAYFEKANIVVGVGIAYNNIGGVYYMLKEYAKAAENYSKSLAIKKKLNDRRGTAVSLANLGEAQMMINSLEKAKESVNESLRIAEEIDSKEQVKVAYELLSKIYERSRDYERALSFERKRAQANDSLFSADKTAQISKMRAIYETEKAEQAAALTKLQSDVEIARSEQERNLFIVAAIFFMMIAGMVFYLYRQKQQSNNLLATKNTLIEKTLREREILLKEIHHRVKNNLQIISSLLSLQSKSLQDAGAQGAISESRNRVKSMSLIHEQLYQEDVISGVDMKNYAERLVNGLVAAYALDTDRVEIKVTADPIMLDVDTAIPLGLIMNELVSNAMKYAFPDQRVGMIKVSFQEIPNELRLVVEDNGIGIDDSSKADGSFGLNMVRSLMRKLKAEMSIVSTAGTSVQLTIRDFRKVTLA